MLGCNKWDTLIGVSLVLFFAVTFGGCSDESVDTTRIKKTKRNKVVATPVNRPKVQPKTNIVKRVRPIKLSPSLLKSLLATAADTDNSVAIVKLAEMYRNNPDPKVRLEFLDTLLELHDKGVIALASFVQDSNEEVSKRATQLIETQLDLITDNYLKSSLLGNVITSLTDEDDLKAFSAKLALLPPEYAVREIVDIVKRREHNPMAYEAVIQEYETITGEPFKSITEANKWVRIHCLR